MIVDNAVIVKIYKHHENPNFCGYFVYMVKINDDIVYESYYLDECVSHCELNNLNYDVLD